MQTHSLSAAFSDLLLSEDEDADIGRLLALMKRAGSEFGIEHFTYFANPRSELSIDQNIVMSSYPEAWQGRYREKEYHMIDPAISNGLRSMLPLDWGMIPKSSSTVRQFFGEAADLGVYENGLTVPIRDPKGGRGLFTVNVDMKGRDWAGYKTEFTADLSYAAFLFHDAALHATGLAKEEKISLSPREIEALQWAANGKTIWETSQIMNVSESAVKLYLANTFAKLKVTSKAHAVARCITHGLFQVH